MKDNKRRAIIKIISILLLFIFCAIGCANDKEESFTELELEERSQQTKPEVEEEQTVYVYVCGAVRTSGVYELSGKARIYEAIAAAGGVTEDAAEEYLNQAKVVTDGEQIYIPTKEELEKGVIEGQAPGASGTDSNTEGKININTAQKEELKTLPGIGDAKADSIISYRDANGAFGQIEDLMQVEGIKEGVFNKIKSNITL